MNDELYIRRCIELAGCAEGKTSPNPMVGSVIVRDGRVIGEGYHHKAGEPHAEVNAVNSVADKSLLKESTLYVNLEPCCHWGKTPPCADLIISMGIPRVVVGMIDPFAAVCGEGIKRMKDAGIDVTTGILEEECRELNCNFITYHTLKRPHITLKWAQTVDGYLDNDRSPEIPPAWMTGPVCRTFVHRMRSTCDAIMAGTNTIGRDNPSLTVRDWNGKTPIRIVLDRSLRLSPDRKVFNSEARTLLFTDVVLTEQAAALHAGKEIIGINFSRDVLTQVMNNLYRKNIQSVMVEGGAAIFKSLIDEGLWDETSVFISPIRLADLPCGHGSGIKAPDITGTVTERTIIDGVQYIRTKRQ